MCGTDCFLMFLSVLFPPIGVWVKRGICSADSLINLALSCLGFLPGLLHAWYIILQYPEPYSYEHVQGNPEGGITYYVVSGHQGAGNHAGHTHAGHYNYGTVVDRQPSAGQFPGQQPSGSANAFSQPNGKKSTKNATKAGDGQPSYAAVNPPTYADVIKGDHKVQKP
ncbi:hypothetical protein GQ43DRAFT_420959 [Delitschia confertaspora ATCC 74209]|uniref:Stress response RCI peptide n=1 Tax=Delitschia confertaspora ATCC 74209 TaxID=1513339 RepID=A0A9P4MN67_9PLEO|nr:hypothetical protein GQ43DRAFT_420959 [Delitschia confertaspora ATCC 74209]